MSKIEREMKNIRIPIAFQDQDIELLKLEKLVEEFTDMLKSIVLKNQIKHESDGVTIDKIEDSTLFENHIVSGTERIKKLTEQVTVLYYKVKQENLKTEDSKAIEIFSYDNEVKEYFSGIIEERKNLLAARKIRELCIDLYLAAIKFFRIRKIKNE